MANSVTEKRKSTQEQFPGVVIYPSGGFAHSTIMINQRGLVAQLQARIDAGDITQGDVARVLGVSDSRMTELFKHGTYQLRLDQAVKLVEAYSLEQAPAPVAAPVPAAIARLVVQYVAEELGVSVDADPERIEAIAEDIRALSALLADPKYRESLEYAEHFLEAMRVRRRVEPAAS